MTTVSGEYPILPLPAVLFPGTFLPMQITEEAHRDLLRECADHERRLGVVLNPGQSGNGRTTLPCTTGCTASVALLLENDDSQAINVVLYGEQRMRVVDFTRQEPYYAGRIEPLDDYTGLHAERRTRQASRLFKRYLDLIRRRYQAQVVNLPLPEDPIMASYLLAAVLYIPLETKQRWLESASAALRLQEELAFLHAECDKIALILALSSQTQHCYATPDAHHFASLISQN